MIKLRHTKILCQFFGPPVYLYMPVGLALSNGKFASVSFLGPVSCCMCMSVYISCLCAVWSLRVWRVSSTTTECLQCDMSCFEWAVRHCLLTLLLVQILTMSCITLAWCRRSAFSWNTVWKQQQQHSFYERPLCQGDVDRMPPEW